MSQTKTNPFSPGAGKMPPHRAGHKEAAGCLEEHLDSVCAKQAGDMVFLYGPRGSGKTALLGELRDRAQTMGAKAVSLNPVSEDGGLAQLAHRLAPRPKFPFLGSRKTKAGVAGLSAGAGPEGGPCAPRVAAVLKSSLAKSPLALIIDGAHELPLRFGEALLNAAQECINARLPLLMTMAGTPDLPSRLRKMEAGFWDRCRQLRIGRLETEEATRKAFSVPAEETGLPFDEDALGLLVRESKDYPLFVQILGKAAWDSAAARSCGARRITAQDARKGMDSAKEEMREFHLELREETIELGVLAEAVAVSEAMMSVGGGEELSEKELMDALISVAPDRSALRAAQNKLSHIGLIWQTLDLGWQPGIPSLCSYFAQHGIEPEPTTDDDPSR